MNIIIATIKSYNIEYSQILKKKYYGEHNIFIIEKKEELYKERLDEIKPDYVFFPHWSWIIPKDIYDNYKCIVFHMTDLPFGRGGSPLQNLIERGIYNTKISAIRVNGGIDTGDIYLKKDLSLMGTADEILFRAAEIIFDNMIPKIIHDELVPYEQKGEVTEFKRRKPEQSELKEEFGVEKIYDYIRMLDGEGYPKAYINFGEYKLEFSRASYKNGKIVADVEIKRKDEIYE